jgi:hypothetical protein
LNSTRAAQLRDAEASKEEEEEEEEGFMKLQDHPKLKQWQVMFWEKGGSGTPPPSSFPHGPANDIFTSATVKDANLQCKVEITCRSVAQFFIDGRDAHLARKLVDLLNAQGPGKTLMEIGNLEVDEDLNMI